jgi:hypothetical protein
MAGAKENPNSIPRENLTPIEPVDSRIVFTPEDLIDMLRLPKFSKALSIAADHTLSTGHEAGFGVEIDRKKQIYIHTVNSGDSESMSNGKVIEEIDEYSILIEKDPDPLFEFHFHPDHTFAVTPSTADIESFAKTGASFMAVGEIDRNESLIILIARKPNHFISDYELEMYEDEVFEARSQNDILQAFTNLGMQTALANLTKKRAGGYAISNSSLAKIRLLDPVRSEFT